MGKHGRESAIAHFARHVIRWAIVLNGLLAGTVAEAQTWVRPGDILFGSATSENESAPFAAVGSFLADGPPSAAPKRTLSAHQSAQPVAVNPSPPELPPAELAQSDAGHNDGFASPAARLPLPTVYQPGPAGSREWHVLPGTLLYHSYLAGEKEPRIGLSVLSDGNGGWLWESALGGRVGILRRGPLGLYPADAWQIDLEGAALARVNPSEDSAPLEAVDYRIGIQWTRRRGPVAYKAGYYHISSHVGDEYLLLNPGFVRINYVRDSLIFGVTRDLTPDVQVYGEVGYALGADGGAEPLEFQFGAQYNPIADTGLRGAPFAAVNVHLREEVDFGGGINVMAGWRWRGAESGRLLRIGLQYYNGKAIQYQFLHEDQQLLGYGIWFDY